MTASTLQEDPNKQTVFFLKEEEKRKKLMRQYKTCNFWGSKPLFQKPKNNLTDDKWKYYTYPVMDGHATILPDTQQKFKYCYMKTFYIAGLVMLAK